MTKPELQLIPLNKIVESPWNPRKHFDRIEQANLTASIRAHGQLVPGTVRPIAGGKFELAAGTRRFRSVKGCELETYLAIVRPLTDAEFCEILAIENDERANVHPLEQANGFKLLMEHSGYDVAKIATRIQRSHEFVYDRIRLLQLNPDLKDLFLENRFGISQAIVLARLSADEQRKAASKPDRYSHRRESGLWRASEPTLGEKEFPYVANTAAELEHWIATHLRFDESKVQLEEQFPETAAELIAAEEAGVRVVAITFSDYLPPSIERTAEKIYTRDFWERADGLEGSKVCDYAVVGVVKTHTGRGQSFGVCVSRDSCTVHWASRVAARKRKEKAKKNGTTPATAAKGKKAKEQKIGGPYTKAQIAAQVKKSKETQGRVDFANWLPSAYESPTAAVVKAALAIAASELEVEGKVTAEQLVVAYAADHIRREMDWNFKRVADAAEAFGLARFATAAVPVTCKYCGCSDHNSCRLEVKEDYYSSHSPCKWISNDPPVCSNPRCVKQHQAAGGKVDTKVKTAAGAAVLDDAGAVDDEAFDAED